MKGHNYDKGISLPCLKCGKVHHSHLVDKHTKGLLNHVYEGNRQRMLGQKHSLEVKAKIKSSVSKAITKWHKEHPMTEETKKKLSEAQKKRFQRKDVWNKGKKMSKELKKKISNVITRKWKQDDYRDITLKGQRSQGSRKKRSENALQMWADSNIRQKLLNGIIQTRPQVREKMMEKWLDAEYRNNLSKSLHYAPNKFEKDFAKEFPILDFVGDLSFFVGTKNPDFILPDTDLCIDLFGDHWHEEDEIQKRIEYFRRHGFKLLVVWEHEWNKQRQLVIERITRFMRDTQNA